MRVSRLCPAMLATATAEKALRGSQTAAARTIIDQPRIHRIPAMVIWKSKLKAQPKHRVNTSSRKISHTPRDARNRLSWLFVRLPRVYQRYAPSPVSSENTGAQKWVIQRVKKYGPVVAAMFVG